MFAKYSSIFKIYVHQVFEITELINVVTEYLCLY